MPEDAVFLSSLSNITVESRKRSGFCVFPAPLECFTTSPTGRVKDPERLPRQRPPFKAAPSESVTAERHRLDHTLDLDGGNFTRAPAQSPALQCTMGSGGNQV